MIISRSTRSSRCPYSFKWILRLQPNGNLKICGQKYWELNFLPLPELETLKNSACGAQMKYILNCTIGFCFCIDNDNTLLANQ